jgi:hypothetical protein
VALVDITDIAKPKVAAVNGDTMMYAASLEDRRAAHRLELVSRRQAEARSRLEADLRR